MQKQSAGLQEVYRLYLFTRSLSGIESIMKDAAAAAACASARTAESLRSRFVLPLADMIAKFDMYQRLVEHVMDFAKLPEFVVSARHDPELKELEDEVHELTEAAQNLAASAGRTWASFVDVRLDRHPQHGFMFRSTKGEDERQLRANNAKVRVLSILKTGCYFTTPELESLGGRVVDVEAEYHSKQRALVAKAVETAATYIPLAESAACLVAELDVLTAFATAAAVAPTAYVRPTMLPRGSGVMRLSKARHPCVELMDNMSFIPNSYDLITGQSQFQIVTGPNMVRPT